MGADRGCPLQETDNVRFWLGTVLTAPDKQRPLPDHKADIAYEETIVQRGNRFDCPLSQARADVG